ncbi:MAG TPA: pseudouridine synthase [Planctomycetaceae bacterium]|nr:pseudouridine synthase [Planctomycetaceae bacterium]
MSEPIRLSKLMAQRGLCSRREADDYISRGLVLVDGVAINTLGTKVLPHQSIVLAEAACNEQQSLVTILLNKPIGYVSGQPEKNYRPAVELVTAERRALEFGGPAFRKEHLRGLAPAGRLDIDSKGLLVFTQDGRLAKQLTGEGSLVEKEYLVRVSGLLDETGLSLLHHGLSLDDKPLSPARVDWINPHQLRFVLTEGRKRQIRRMCDKVGLKVTAIKRVRIGHIALGRLPEGQWRYLGLDEHF